MKQKMKERASRRPCFVVPFRIMVTAALAGIGMVLGACEPSELRPVPALPSGGSQPAPRAPAPAAPSEPLAPPVMLSSQHDPSQYEIHGAVTAADCYQMLQRFHQEGRRVWLKAVERNPANQGGGVLEWMCVFDGEDASPTATPFEDNRFPSGEYDYP